MWQNCQRGAALDREQPGRLEVAGDDACPARPDHGGGPDDGHVTRMAARDRGQRLDLQVVADEPVSGSADSGASSGSGTVLSASAPYTIALVTRTTRRTRAAARR